MESQPSLEELLPTWLAEHGSLFRFDHCDESYFYRRLSRREYRLALMIEEEYERSDQVVETCLLWPQGWLAADHQGDPAGIIEAIATAILRDSGCADLQATKRQYEANMANLEVQMESVIEHIFGGGGDFSKYQDWSYDQLFDSYARACWVSGALLGKPITEQKDEAPKKRGSRPEGAPDRIAIPDIDSGQMGLKPMHEVMERNRMARRQQAVRNMGAQASSTPVRKPAT